MPASNRQGTCKIQKLYLTLHYIKCLNLTMQAELMTACTYVACRVLHVLNLISITIYLVIVPDGSSWYWTNNRWSLSKQALRLASALTLILRQITGGLINTSCQRSGVVLIPRRRRCQEMTVWISFVDHRTESRNERIDWSECGTGRNAG